MRAGTEYLTSNTFVAYPFREDANGIVYGQAVHGALAYLPADIFVDALAIVLASSPFYLQNIVFAGGTTYQLNFGRDGTVTTLTLTIDLTTLNAANTFTLFTGDAGTTTLRIVADTRRLIDYLTTVTATDTFGTRLPFECAAVEQRCPKLLSFQIYNNGLNKPPSATGIAGSVIFRNGYNTALTVDTDTATDTSAITLDITPGVGEGTVPCEAVEPVEIVRPKMNVIADQTGNIQIAAGDECCYAVIPVVATDTFMLQGRCNSCCSCEDYSNMLAALKRLATMAGNANIFLNDAHTNSTSGYNAGVTYFNSVINTRFSRPAIEINGVVGSPYEGERIGPGAPGWVAFVISLKNLGPNPLTVNTVTMALGSPAGPIVIERIAWDYQRQSRLLTPTGTISFAPAAGGLGTITPGTTVSFYVDCFILLGGWNADPTWSGNLTASITETTGTGPVISTLGPKAFIVT